MIHQSSLFIRVAIGGVGGRRSRRRARRRLGFALSCLARLGGAGLARGRTVGMVLILHRLAIIGVGIGARLGIELARAQGGRATRLADHCLVGWRTSRARRVGPSNELTPRVGRAGAEFARQCNRLRPQARRDPLAAARRVGVADEGGAVVRPGMATVAHPWRYEFLAIAAGPRARAPPPTSRRRVVGRPVLARALDLLKVKLNGPDEAVTAAAGFGASETACSVVISQPVPARARILLFPCDIVTDQA